MTIRHPLVWMGMAAALAAAIFIPMLVQQQEPVALQVVAEANLFPFVRSLEGTYPDGDINAEADVLVADAELVRLFDYYLATIGEKPLDAIRAEIEQALDRRLKPAAAAEAKRLLARYIDYKTALVELEKNPQADGNGIAAIRGRMEMMQQIRARFFNAEENKDMFGFDDAYDMDALARLEVSQDKSLTEVQKREKLAALDAALPPEVQEAREAPLKIVKLEESASKMRAEGASEDEIYRMRAAELSPEAAARMAEVERDEVAWNNRIAAYLAERSKQGNAEAIAALRNRLFDADEQKRLPAYEN